MNNDYVSVNADELGNIGKNISSLAEDTRSLTTAIKNEIDSVREAWTGTSANEYMNNAYSEIENIDRLVEAYSEAGTGISKTAENYNEVDASIRSAMSKGFSGQSGNNNSSNDTAINF